MNTPNAVSLPSKIQFFIVGALGLRPLSEYVEIAAEYHGSACVPTSKVKPSNVTLAA